jgi:hypothetical protein
MSTITTFDLDRFARAAEERDAATHQRPVLDRDRTRCRSDLRPNRRPGLGRELRGTQHRA